jgi:hypothetical protein
LNVKDMNLCRVSFLLSAELKKRCGMFMCSFVCIECGVKMIIFRLWQELFCMDAQFSSPYVSSLCFSPQSTLHRCVLYFWDHFLATIFLWHCKRNREYQ